MQFAIRPTMQCSSRTLCLLTLLVWGQFVAQAQADLILSKSHLGKLPENKLAIVAKLLSEGKLEEAVKGLEMHAAEQSDLAHPELLLVQILLDKGKARVAQQRLDAFSVNQQHAFEISLAYARIAALQQRWYDGWTHVAVAEQSEIPQRWSSEFQQEVRGELMIVKAMCNEGRGDWAGAREAYGNAKRFGVQNDPRLLSGVGRTEFQLGNTGASLAAFRLLHETDNAADPAVDLAATPAELSIAKLYDVRGDEKKAEQWYRRAADVSGEGAAVAKLQFARWLVWHNRPQETESLLKEPLLDASQEQERQYLSALVARMQQRFPEAQELLSKLHQESPAEFSISNQLALVLIESSQETARGRALQIAESNVRNHQQQAEAWSTLGWIQLRLGDIAAAQKSLTLATRSGQVSRDTAHFIAELQETAGESLAALEFRQAAEKANGPSFYQGGKQP